MDTHVKMINITKYTRIHIPCCYIRTTVYTYTSIYNIVLLCLNVCLSKEKTVFFICKLHTYLYAHKKCQRKILNYIAENNVKRIYQKYHGFSHILVVVYQDLCGYLDV